MVTPTSFEVDVLGGVGEQREPVEGTNHVQLLVQRQRRQETGQFVDLAHVVMVTTVVRSVVVRSSVGYGVAGPGRRVVGAIAAGPHRGAPNGFDRLEGRQTRLVGNDLSEQPAEQSDVVARLIGSGRFGQHDVSEAPDRRRRTPIA
jgi:hypothetical protein